MRREIIRPYDFSEPETIRDELRALSPRSWWVYSFSEPPTLDQAMWLAREQRRCPDEVVIRFFECTQADFAFLRHFSGVKTLNIQLAVELENLEFLNDLTSLDILCLPETRSTRISLLPLAGLKHLRVLHMCGSKVDAGRIREMQTLEKLKLESFKLEDVSWLGEASRLRWLAIDRGKIVDWDAMPELSVRYLRLVEVKGPVNLEFLSSIKTLEILHLEGMREVVRLPEFSGQPLLRRMYLNRLSRLTDVSPLLTARHLEDLIMEESEMDAERIRPLASHPTLKHARIGTKSVKKNAAIEEVLCLNAEEAEFVYADGSVERA